MIGRDEDSKGRKIKPLQRIAFRFNSMRGQIAMAKGCLHSVLRHNSECKVSPVTLARISNALMILEDIYKELETDYIIQRLKVKAEERKEKLNEQSRQSDLQESK